MKQNAHKCIKHLIRETGDAFTQSGGGNIDYAGFASMAIHDFKVLLGDPALTDQKLRHMIRGAEKDRRMVDPQGSWSSFLARHIEHSCNQNKNS